MRTYQLKLIPRKGPTLKNRTQEEYNLGYEFKIVSSNLPSYSRGQRVTKQEIDNLGIYYGFEVALDFVVQSVKEHLEEEAEASYGFGQAAHLWKAW